MKNTIKNIQYETRLPGSSHWSLKMRRGTIMRITDLNGHANVGLLFYNPENLLERYNAPDTLKCQHTFKLTQNHCLYSDMGRIFASITEDQFGWHDTVCGNSHADQIAELWGQRDYQQHRNEWHQNGTDAFLVELAKYGLGKADLASNLNLFSKVAVGADGQLSLAQENSKGKEVVLRFEMDTLVLIHTCPHPLNVESQYPERPVLIELGEAETVSENDACLMHCDENIRGFKNNNLYHLGNI
jgi:urea carboxylase-associated protein 2